MKKINSLLLLISIFYFSSVSATDYTLKLKSGDVQLTALAANDNLSVVANANQLDGYAIVQFHQIPTEAEKVTLKSNGVSLLEYLPNYAFIARLNNPSNVSIGELNIRSITPFELDYKIANRLKYRENPDWAVQGDNKLDLTIALQLDQLAPTASGLIIAMGGEILETNEFLDFINVRISEDKIDALQSSNFVKFLDYVPAPPEKEDTRARSLHRGNMLDSDHALGRKYDGTGVSVSIADDGTIGPHIDFTGRVTQLTNQPGGTHGDMTSGITVGAGNLDPRYRGHATGAYLYYYSINGYPHIANAVTNLATRGVVVTSTSYSQGCNNYENTARGIDQQVRQNPELLHVFSAGNSASSNCGYGGGTHSNGRYYGNITGGRKQGKAVIATGNLEYQGDLTLSSSRGPSEDGRIKPDICANGTNQVSTDPNNTYAPGGGTSAAAPSIAGLAAQLYHGYRDINGGANPESGLIKAAMLNTARDIGNRGPDFFFGWGRVNAHRAMSLLEDNRYTSSTIAQNATDTHTIVINQNLEQLRVMVYWTDFEGSTVASKALVNDLDIRLVTPNGDSIRPWVLDPTPIGSRLSAPATRGIDDLNNVEQVTIDTVPQGTYKVIVNGTAVPQGPQKYYVLWETKTDSIEVTYPAGGEAFVPGESETIRWDAVEGSGNFTVSYSTNNGTTWTPIGTVTGTRRYLDWNNIPNVTSGNMLVRVSRGGVNGISSRNFSIMTQPQNFAVDYICPDSVKLRWNPVSGATGYVIYQLGSQYMDSIGYSATTNFSIYNLNLANDNWFSIKAVGNGIESRRRRAFLLPKAPLNCPLPYDVNITQISSPIVTYLPICNVNKVGVRITINNAGDSVLTNIPLKLYANGNVYLDTLVGPMQPNAFQFFDFSDSVTLNPGQSNIAAVADFPNDANELNDSVSITMTAVNGVGFSPPYNFDFETFGTCATTSNCGQTICTLNNGWINMPNGSVDDFDMRTDVGGTPSAGTGPSIDHNPGTSAGKYIYSEASNGCTGVESHVLSPCFDLSNTINPEFSFWYHMNGSNMGIIRVDVLEEGVWRNNAITPLFGNQGNQWLQQTVNLSAYVGKTINVRFRITTGNGFESDLAIDDVSLIDRSTGLDETSLNSDFVVYPNPSEGIFQIKTTENMNNLARVFDLQGRMIKQVRLSGTFTTLDLSHLDKGIYLLDIDGRQDREKLIIY